MQNILKYLMRLRLHVSVIVPLSDPRSKAKASERQGKARHLLYERERERERRRERRSNRGVSR
jgi:hypothetical protein